MLENNNNRYSEFNGNGSSPYGNTGSTGNPYGNIGSTGTQYGSTGTPYGGTGSTGSTGSPVGTGGEKKEKKKNGLLKKVGSATFSGVVFGLCAGFVILIILNVFPIQGLTGKNVMNGDTRTISTVATSETTDEKEADSQDSAKEKDASGNTTSVIASDVSGVVESVMPSVVSITGMYQVDEQYFGYGTESEEAGSGSGIIVGQTEDELLIVTNNHVVEDSKSLSVQFIDEESYDAQIKGTDGQEDLAVIAVKTADLKETTVSQIKVATLGDSDTLKVGEPAIAIGNALGYGQSVTTGVISAVNREYTTDNYTTYLIQTDAAINPGNSGGALINMNGEVIGINSNKIAGTTVEGMGYAIPISTAKPIIDELVTKTARTRVDEANKGYLGISGVNVTADVQEQYGLPAGVYIANVYEGTAAESAGLVKGDIITKFDGQTIGSFEELSDLLGYYTEGTEVKITIMQGSADGYQEKEVTVTLGGKAQ